MKTAETQVKPTLHLNLIGKWFDMVESGEKTEEYREIKPFYAQMFHNGNIKIKGKYYHPTDVELCFSNGYSKHRRQHRFECKGLRVGFGKTKWGAKEGVQYYIIKIGVRHPANSKPVEINVTDSFIQELIK